MGGDYKVFFLVLHRILQCHFSKVHCNFGESPLEKKKNESTKWSEKKWHSGESGGASVNMITATICLCSHNLKIEAAPPPFLKKKKRYIHINIGIFSSFPKPSFWWLPGQHDFRQRGHYISRPVSRTRAERHQGPMSVCRRLQTMTGGLAPLCCAAARNLKSALNSQGSLWPVKSGHGAERRTCWLAELIST